MTSFAVSRSETKTSRHRPELGATSSERPQFISQQLRSLLLQGIAAGRLAVGAKILSECALAEDYKISRTSVREALAQLLVERVLVRGTGRGTYVAETQSVTQPKFRQIGF